MGGGDRCPLRSPGHSALRTRKGRRLLMFRRLFAFFAPTPRSAEAWLARMGRGRLRGHEEAAFHAWLEADPAHLPQYESLKALQVQLEDVRGGFEDDLARWRRQPAQAPPLMGRRGLVGGLAAAGLVAVVVTAPLWSDGRGPRLYESLPGQILDVALEDGTQVTLDADSAIDVHLSRGVRQVSLHRGAAYFDVVHDGARPFQVAVGDRQVIVVGTRFVTSLRGDGAEISVLQGRVLVSRPDPGRADTHRGAASLTVGDTAQFRVGDADLVTARADVEAHTAWRRRRLVFRNATLAEVVSAAARYSERPLVAADPRLNEITVTAVLPLDGEGELAQRMASLLPIRVTRDAEGRVLVRAE